MIPFHHAIPHTLTYPTPSQAMNLEVARKAFIRIRDVRYVELVNRTEAGKKQVGVNPQGWESAPRGGSQPPGVGVNPQGWVSTPRGGSQPPGVGVNPQGG